MNNRNSKNNFNGSTVFVHEGEDIGRALRKLKKKVEASGKLKEVKERECYEKPTTKRKRALAAAKARQAKKVRDQKLPPKHF